MSVSRVNLLLLALLSLQIGGSEASEYDSGRRADLIAQPVVRDKIESPVSNRAREFLRERDGDTVSVWVFFTDKGVRNQSEYALAASSVVQTERSLSRRARCDVDKVLFADLPVVPAYIDEIVDMGVKYRRTSRWLNAASFETSSELLDVLAGLPFVAEIRPLAQFRRPEMPEEDLSSNPGESGAAPSFSPPLYGNSFAQLNQIGVPAVHDKGFSGQGVTLAIMDTGFRKSHEAFAQHLAQGRLLAEYDFVFDDGNTANETEDVSSQWNHGTAVWSTAAGQVDFTMYGPAFRANIILCKTEDMRSETPIEEDNWVAALEFADSVGTDVVTTSLGYSAWYSYEDYDGLTATITIAANTCDGLGIVMCNSMGNHGPAEGTLTPPADAFNILAVGAVSSNGTIASFSSRGPTYDGRTKPEVCARGVSDYTAVATNDSSYGGNNGTSFATPLVAGAACLLIEARPTFTPALIRKALKQTACIAPDSNNTYGWGIIDVNAALDWGTDFVADVRNGEAPLTVQFTSQSVLGPTAWSWDFGDGGASTEANPTHEYLLPGIYTVSMSIETPYGPFTNEKVGYIVTLGDTLSFVGDSAFAGDPVNILVRLRNSRPLDRIVIPFELPDSPVDLALVDVYKVDRSSYFESMRFLSFDAIDQRYVLELKADDGGGSPPLEPGVGNVLIIRANTDRFALGGLTDTVAAGAEAVTLESELISYEPFVRSGLVSTKSILRCDVDYSNDGVIDIGDLTALIAYLYIVPRPPVTIQSSDCNGDRVIDISDLTLLISYLFYGGFPPASP